VRNAKDVKYARAYAKTSEVMKVTITPAKSPGSN